MQDGHAVGDGLGDELGEGASVPTEPEQLPMVRWYSPRRLLENAYQVVSSSIVGRRLDFRHLEAIGTDGLVFDYADAGELWFDYTADLGDGWNSTFSIASLLAREEIVLEYEPSKPVVTQRGRFLVMGGDEVYPVASRDAYKDRLQAPYNCAMRKTPEPHADLYAIPGNHDWYGGLSAFSRLFCRRRTIGNWQTRQDRSYFAHKLPHNWWLLAVDIQLQEDIDGPQLDYFKCVADKMQPGDRVILCTAEPDWIKSATDDPQLSHNLAYLEQRVIPRNKARVAVMVAGDLHHYRRHAAADGTQFLTAGGGGAFLHPTHGVDVDHINYRDKVDLRGVKPVPLTLEKEYPDRDVSRRLARKILAFPRFNWQFGIVTGFLYALIGLLTPVRLFGVDFGEFGKAYEAIFNQVVVDRTGFIVILFVLLCGWAFSGLARKPAQVVAAIAHGLAHVVLALIVTWAADAICVGPLGVTGGALPHLALAGVGTFAAGYLVGPLVFGIYMWAAVSWLGMHTNEAFSAIRVEDYKHFLRFHIAKDGSLTIHPIAIDRVPRNWQRVANPQPGAPAYVPAAGQTLDPRAIEDQPIVVRPR